MRTLKKKFGDTEDFVCKKIVPLLGFSEFLVLYLLVNFQGFLDLDQAMLEENMQEKVAGSTAVVVLIKDNTLYCANVGDSRAVASVSGAVSY